VQRARVQLKVEGITSAFKVDNVFVEVNINNQSKSLSDTCNVVRLTVPQHVSIS